jgi:hypothetical protein
MLEGAGRTLKGRDLRRVRDAVLRQTGWLDWIRRGDVALSALLFTQES